MYLQDLSLQQVKKNKMEGNDNYDSLLSDNTVVYVIIIPLPVQKKWAEEM